MILFFILNICFFKIFLYCVKERYFLMKRIFYDLYLVKNFFNNSDFKKKCNDGRRDWVNVEILEIIIVVKVIDNCIKYIGDSKYILDSYLIVWNIIYV